MVQIVPAAVRVYATNVFVYRVKAWNTLFPDYVEPVTQYAAMNFDYVYIYDALHMNIITQEVYDDIIERRITAGLPIDWMIPSSITTDEGIKE